MDKNGYVQVHTYNGAWNQSTSKDKPVCRISINGVFISAVHGNGIDSNSYTGFDSALFPVSIGDVVAIVTADWNQYNYVYFYPYKIV